MTTVLKKCKYPDTGKELVQKGSLGRRERRLDTSFEYFAFVLRKISEKSVLQTRRDDKKPTL